MNISGTPTAPVASPPPFEHDPGQAPDHGAADAPMLDKGPARIGPDAQAPGRRGDQGQGSGRRQPDQYIAVKPSPYPLPDCGPRPLPRPPIDCLLIPMPKPFPRPPFGCDPIPMPKPLPHPPIGCEPKPLPPTDCWPKPRPPIGEWPRPTPPIGDWPKPQLPEPPIGCWPPMEPPKDPGCGCEDPLPPFQLNDTKESRYQPFCGPEQVVLDTGRWGPDKVDITIHCDGSSSVNVNGETYEYSAEETRNLHVRVDDNDKVKVTDHRSPIVKILSPNPVDVFNVPDFVHRVREPDIQMAAAK